MGKQKQPAESEESQPTEAQDRGSGPAEAPSDDLDARIESALGKLAASGRLVGGEESAEGGNRAGASSDSSSPSFDLDHAIERAFKRREEASTAEAEGKRTQERLHALENPPKKRRWLDPWRP